MGRVNVTTTGFDGEMCELEMCFAMDQIFLFSNLFFLLGSPPEPWGGNAYRVVACLSTFYEIYVGSGGMVDPRSAHVCKHIVLSSLGRTTDHHPADSSVMQGETGRRHRCIPNDTSGFLTRHRFISCSPSRPRTWCRQERGGLLVQGFMAVQLVYPSSGPCLKVVGIRLSFLLLIDIWTRVWQCKLTRFPRPAPTSNSVHSEPC